MLPGESPIVKVARSRSSSLDLRAPTSVACFGNDEGPGLVERRWGLLATRWAASDLRKLDSASGGDDVLASSERLLELADDSLAGLVESWTSVSTT